jgi:hypothetical protein
LREAATLSIPHARWSVAEGRLRARIVVENHTGHKLPTGYLDRRAWLRLTVRDAAGALLFRSGDHDRAGRIVERSGRSLEASLRSHRTTISDERHVVVWNAIPVDAAGAPTHRLTEVFRLSKDDRILPRGWRSDDPDALRAAPAGIGEDADYRSPGGWDAVDVDVRLPARPVTIEAEVLYQSVPPAAIESYDPSHGPASRAFLAMTARRPPLPLVIARTSTTVE